MKEQLSRLEEEHAEAARLRDEALARPSPPHRTSAPDGDTDEEAEEIRRWGEPPKLEQPKEHTEIGRFDMERAARVSGARFGYLARRRGAPRVRAVPLRARPARRARVHSRDAAGARA